LGGIHKTIAEEWRPSKIGIHVSVVVIVASIATKINTPWFSLNPEYALLIFLIGIAMFFFFNGINLNTEGEYRKIEGQLVLLHKMPKNYTSVSKACFWVSGILFVFIIILLIKSIFL